MKSLYEAFEIILKGTIALLSYPKLLVPVLFTWALYAPTILYFRYSFDWSVYDLKSQLSIHFLIIFFLSFILSFSCMMLLELIEHIESGKKASLLKAFYDCLFKNTLKALPIMLLWAIIWFVITILQAIFSRKDKNGGENSELSLENANRTLSGIDNRMTTIQALLHMLNKGVRMISFTIFPAICWEDKGPIDSIRSGFNVVAKRWQIFLSGYLLTEVVLGLIFFPIWIYFVIIDDFHINTHVYVDALVLIYISFTWSYYIFIEQIFCAELYLWQKNYLRAVEVSIKIGRHIPEFSEVKKPCLIDEIDDFVDS
ncbi:MAG: hypothetical protein VX341_00290 [Bdellovibrionota bacterium]|nr:hypothetical protein [Bdellovibrionota bacterium]